MKATRLGKDFSMIELIRLLADTHHRADSKSSKGPSEVVNQSVAMRRGEILSEMNQSIKRQHVLVTL